MSEYTYIVTVTCETEAQARQVMTERIHFDEEVNSDADGNEYDPGFDYSIDFDVTELTRLAYNVEHHEPTD